MPAWQQRSAQAVHLVLYGLFFAVPLAGWAHSSAAGVPIMWFGVLQLPDFVPVDKALARDFKELHEAFAWALMVMVALHVAAALKHQFIDRDGLLARMWPGRA
jgi:cytochrome b561